MNWTWDEILPGPPVYSTRADRVVLELEARDALQTAALARRICLQVTHGRPAPLPFVCAPARVSIRIRSSSASVGDQMLLSVF